MRTIGDRLNKFDNAFEQTVQTFNEIFTDVPLTGYSQSDTVLIGEITANLTTRQLLINNIAIEHSFVRRTTSEDDYIDTGDNAITDDTDPAWLFYFV